MFAAITIQDADGNDAALLDTVNGRRTGTCSGLHGLPGPRRVVRPRPGGHGEINNTKHYGSRQPVFEGFITGDTQAEVWAEYDEILQALWGLVEEERTLKWTRQSAVTNLVTNPSFETGTTGWVAWIGITGTPARSTAQAHVGEASLSSIISAASTAPGWTAPVTLVSGTQYTAALWIYTPRAGTYRIRFRDQSAAETNGSTLVVSANTWTLLPAVTRTAAANGSAILRVELVSGATWTAGDEVFIDGAIVAAGSSVPAYFDGDTSGGSWTGTAHASTSVDKTPLQSMVKLAAAFDPVVRATDAGRLLAFQLIFDREDPRNYGQYQVTVTGDTLSDASGGDIFPDIFPDTFTASGGGEVVVQNTGTIPTPVVFRVYGEMSSPSILNTDTGELITLTGEVSAGDYLEVDTAQRSVTLGGIDRTNLVDFAATNWLAGEAQPGETTFRLLAATFDASARLDVLYRPAFA